MTRKTADRLEKAIRIARLGPDAAKIARQLAVDSNVSVFWDGADRFVELVFDRTVVTVAEGGVSEKGN